jgi:hypothetical protein
MVQWRIAEASRHRQPRRGERPRPELAGVLKQSRVDWDAQFGKIEKEIASIDQ